MEYDLYYRNEVPDEKLIEEYRVPKTGTYYRPFNLIGTHILPIRNIILNDEIKIILNDIKNIFASLNNLNQSNKKKPLANKDNELLNLFTQFSENKLIKPITVRQTIPINNPSPSDPLIPSILGFGAPLITYHPISTDYFYKVIHGYNEIAMSLYFKYDNIPVVVQF